MHFSPDLMCSCCLHRRYQAKIEGLDMRLHNLFAAACLVLYIDSGTAQPNDRARSVIEALIVDLNRCASFHWATYFTLHHYRPHGYSAQTIENYRAQARRLNSLSLALALHSGYPLLKLQANLKAKVKHFRDLPLFKKNIPLPAFHQWDKKCENYADRFPDITGPKLPLQSPPQRD